MYNGVSNKVFNFLIYEIGLSKSSVELGLKLANKNNISLPIALWSHGLINTDELDKIYNFIWS